MLLSPYLFAATGTTPMMKNKETWLFLFFSGLLCFNWPFLEIFRHSLPLYFFLMWAGFILIVFLLTTRNPTDHDAGADV